MAKERQPRARKKPAAPAPAVADPTLSAKLRTAAESIGVSVEELADMMADGSIRPPKENLTRRYSLEDLGQRLWSELQMRARPLRAEWFSKLADIQQRALIVVLRHNGYASKTIADEFQIEQRVVVHTWNTYCDELGSQVVGMRLEGIIGQLTTHSERAMQLAAESRDHNAIWKIGKEYVESMQSLGVVDRAIQKVHHVHSLGDAQKAEIDEMALLEAKKDRRREELKQIEAKEITTDHMPQLTTDYDDESDQEKL